MPTMSVAIFKPALANCCVIPKRSMGAYTAFLHWPGRSVTCAGLNPSLNQPSRGEDWQKGRGRDEAAMT
jgi:hypothetical protein